MARISIVNKTDWPTSALRVIAAWVVLHSRCKKRLSITIRNSKGSRWSVSACTGRAKVDGQMRLHRRFDELKWPYMYNVARDIEIELRSRLDLLVFCFSWIAQCADGGSSRWDRAMFSKRTVLAFHDEWFEIRKSIREALRAEKDEKPKAKTPIQCKRLQKALLKLDEWQKALKLAQTKVYRYTKVVDRLERALEKKAGA